MFGWVSRHSCKAWWQVLIYMYIKICVHYRSKINDAYEGESTVCNDYLLWQCKHSTIIKRGDEKYMWKVK